MREHAYTPAAAAVHDALLMVAVLLDQPVCWVYRRALHFVVADGVTVAVSPESAGRLRVDRCVATVPVATLWTRIDDGERLAGIVLDLSESPCAPQTV